MNIITDDPIDWLERYFSRLLLKPHFGALERIFALPIEDDEIESPLDVLKLFPAHYEIETVHDEMDCTVLIDLQSLEIHWFEASSVIVIAGWLYEVD